MRQTMDAIYENGVFKPLARPGIAEGQRVRLKVETLSEDMAIELLQLAAQVYQGLSSEQIDEIERIACSRNGFFGERVP